jgi:hypothetical protein
MTENTPSAQDREAARAAMEDLPAETALGNVDPATASSPDELGRKAEEVAAEKGFTASTDGDGDSEAASDRAEQGAGDRSGLVEASGRVTPFGDESTDGDAAREALGIDPDKYRPTDTLPDNSTGEATHAEVVADEA